MGLPGSNAHRKAEKIITNIAKIFFK